MNNKVMINRLKDNAELAMAAYGYFHLADSKYDFNKDNTDKRRLKYFRDIKRDELIKQNPNTTDQELQNTYPTHSDILNIEYKYFKDENGKLQDSWYHKHFLGGDFSPLQSQNFFERYNLLKHCPNTDSGFSATLFKDTKADSKDSEYILSIRGTEFKLEQIQDLLNDYYIGTNNSDMNRVIEQYFDMLLFYEETLKPLLQEKGIARINVVGHSLGGYLAQLFALSYPHSINEVYTYNAPGIMSDKITNTLYWVAQGIGFTLAAKSIKCIFRAKTIISSFGSLSSSPRPFEAKNVLLNKQDKDVIVGIIPIRSSYKSVITFNNMNNDDSMEQRIISNTYTNDVPYFLRDDGYKFANENRQPIFYYKDIGKYAREFYELMSDSRYEGKYLYYQYTLHNATTQASVAKFDYLILDYDLSAPYSEMVNRLQFMTENKQYPDPIITNNNIFRVVSIDSKGAMDTIGYLGNHMFGYDSSIVVETTNIINTHSLIPLTQTLYFYSYLLELDSNNEMIESKLNTQDKKEKLQKYIHELNVFMDNIRLSMNILINEIDKENVKKYEKYRQNTKWYQTTSKYEEIDFLPLFISQINEKAYKIESLKQDNNQYFQSNINKEEMIDSILKLQEKSYLIEMFDIDKLKELRNNCKADKKFSITEKLSLATCQPFELVNSQNMALINKNNVNSIFGYLHLGYLLTQEWHEEYINGRYKIMKGLYFNGKTSSSFSQYMIKRDDEKEAINH